MKTSKILLTVLFAVLFINFISTASADSAYDTSNTGTRLFVSVKTADDGSKSFEISVAVYTGTATKNPIDIQRMAQNLKDTQAQGGSILKYISDNFKSGNLGDFNTPYLKGQDPVNDAHIRVQYLAGGSTQKNPRWSDVPGCAETDNLITNKQRALPDGGTDYYAICQIPKSLYEEACTQFRINVIPQPGQNYEYTQAFKIICDDKISSLSTFINGIKGLFGSSNSSLDPKSLGSIVFAALVGLLLASMYFSGKSPISLLDIAQPRLPGPKGLSAGGQILGPFGYTEMKKTTMDKLKSGALAIGTSAAAIKLGSGSKSDISRIVGGMKLNALEKNIAGEEDRAKKFATGLGSLYAKNFGDVGKIRDLLNRHINDYTDAQHKQLAEVLNRLEKRATGHDLFLLRQLRHHIEGTMLYRQLMTLTGYGETASGKVRNWALAKTVGGGRYSVISYWLPPLVDSTVRSAPVFGRFINATGAELAFGIGKGAQRLAELTGDERLKLATNKRLQGLYAKLDPYRADKIQIGGKAPIYDKADYYYKTLENGAYRDLMQHVLKKIYQSYGINLELEQLLGSRQKEKASIHDLLSIDLVQTATSRLHNEESLKFVETQIRKIMAQDELSEREKLERLIQLAGTRGINFEGTPFMGAVNSLDHIAASSIEDHLKLLDLQKNLQDSYKNPEDGFRYSVGRRLNDQEAFEAVLFQRMIHDMESRLFSEKQGMDIKSALAATSLDLENRSYTVNPLAAMGNKLANLRDERGNIRPEAIEEANKIARMAFGAGGHFIDATTLSAKAKALIANEKLKTEGLLNWDTLPQNLQKSLSELGITPLTMSPRSIVDGKQLIEMHERGLDYMKNFLLAEEGKAALKEIFGDRFNSNKLTILDNGRERPITMNELQFVLYGGPEMLRARGYTPDQIQKIGIQFDVSKSTTLDPKTGKVLWFGGAAEEFKPNTAYWKADMGRFWHIEGPSDRESFAIAQWVKNRFARPHDSALDVDIETQLNRKRGAVDYELDKLRTEQRLDLLVRKGQLNDRDRHAYESLKDKMNAEGRLTETAEKAQYASLYRKVDQAVLTGAEQGLIDRTAMKILIEDRGVEARQLWVKKELLNDVHNRLNSMSPETYDVTQNRVRDLSRQMAGMLADALEKKDRDKWSDVITKLKSGSETESMQTLKEQLPLHADLVREYMKKPVTYEDVSTGGKAWVMLYEGGLVPYVKGMKISDNDRVLGGYVALKDEKGTYRRFDPNAVTIDLISLKRKGELSALEAELEEVRKKKGARGLESELEALINEKIDALRKRNILSKEEHEEYYRISEKIAHGEILADSEERLLESFRNKLHTSVLGAKERELEALENGLKYQMAWNALAMEIDAKGQRADKLGNKWSWDELLKGLNNWKNEVTSGTTERYEREKMFESVLWRYRNVTHDWSSYQEFSATEIVSKREATPLAPQFMRSLLNEDNLLLRGINNLVDNRLVKGARNAMLGLGDAISRLSLAAGGPVLNASYAVTPFSEYYRLQSWHLANDILRMKKQDWDKMLEDVADPKERAQIRGAYEAAALSHGAYHQVWDYAVDRNPWRSSTSYGAHQAWGSYFHFGPAEPFSLKNNLRTLYTGQQHATLSESESKYAGGINRLASNIEWGVFNAQFGKGAEIARNLFLPFAIAARGFQYAIQGNPSRWDIKNSPMKAYNYTTPRVGEAFRSLSPFYSFGAIKYPFDLELNVPEYFKKIPILNRLRGDRIDIMEPWGSSLERTHLGGRDFGAGLKQGPLDISFIRTGLYATARTGESNPGASYYDYRMYLHLDPAMAEYLAYRSGKMSAYFREEGYVKRQAHIGTIKREVAAEAKAMRSEEELRGFGGLHNPIYSWYNPLLYLWHSPIPFLPQLSPKEWVFGYYEKKKRGEKTSIKETAIKTAQDWYEKARYNFAPVKFEGGFEIAPGTQWRPGRKVFSVSCGRCGQGGYLGTICRHCQTILYNADYAPNNRRNAVEQKWAGSYSVWANQRQIRAREEQNRRKAEYEEAA